MDEELSDAVLLREEIEAHLHQLDHLQRSQSELQAALVDTPEDIDFKQAYDENTIIITQKIDKLRVLKRRLEAVDVSFQREQRILERLNNAIASLGNLAVSVNVSESHIDTSNQVDSTVINQQAGTETTNSSVVGNSHDDDLQGGIYL